MKDLLFLVHRIPYPPNKGDKIRSFHLLKALSASYRVHLGTFVDTPEDAAHVEALRNYCASIFAARIQPSWRKLLALQGLLSGKPLTDVYYRHSRLMAWCRDTIKQHSVSNIVAFSSSMAQFARGGRFAHARRIMDFCDIDSDKWRQYSQRRRGPLAWIYSREATALLALERNIAHEFDASLFVSDSETETFRRLAPEVADRVHTIRNGVDTSYFDPTTPLQRPEQCDAKYVVFTGAMDYWANVEGVTWFAEHVWPRARAVLPAAKLFIVGSKPTDAVMRLSMQPGIVVTGAVPDVRPYLRFAQAAVAPLRIARGVQNKVLEAMAMERHVIAAPPAVQGLDGNLPHDVTVADDPAQYAELVIAALRKEHPATSAANRDYVKRRFGWESSLQQFLALVDGVRSPGEPA